MQPIVQLNQKLTSNAAFDFENSVQDKATLKEFLSDHARVGHKAIIENGPLKYEDHTNARMLKNKITTCPFDNDQNLVTEDQMFKSIKER